MCQSLASNCGFEPRTGVLHSRNDFKHVTKSGTSAWLWFDFEISSLIYFCYLTGKNSIDFGIIGQRNNEKNDFFGLHLAMDSNTKLKMSIDVCCTAWMQPPRVYFPNQLILPYRASLPSNWIRNKQLTQRNPRIPGLICTFRNSRRFSYVGMARDLSNTVLRELPDRQTDMQTSTRHTLPKKP